MGVEASRLPAPNGMSESNPSGRVRYFASFDYSMDEKRRLPVPARWRTADAENEFFVILWEGNGDAGACLRVYPPEQMESLINRIKTMSTSDPAAVALRRNIGENCEPVTTEHLANAAGLLSTQQVKLAGAVEWFEIWNPDRHKIVREQDSKQTPESNKLI